jgi:phosphoglycerate dehydrogenase-like enzyme
MGLAFGMDVVAWSANLTSERAAAAGVRAVSKSELFSTSDVISLHLALGETTKGTVGEAELRAMKPSACIVNTARAGLIDEPALVTALRERRIGGAALDVYAIEPLPADHVFRKLDNVLVTPHLGYVTREMLTSYYAFAIENMAAYLDGAPIRVVTPQT